MNRWVGKVAVVTGASAGIGLGIVKALVHEGMIVVGVARRKAKMESEMKSTKGKGKFYAMECDVSKTEDVDKVFDWIKKNLGTVHVLVNNAGVVVPGKIFDSNKEEWEKMLGVNVLGLLYCSQQAVKMMQESGGEGHVIHINSITGHRPVRNLGFYLNIYAATKRAVTSLTDSMQMELVGGKIKISSISPGFVATDIIAESETANSAVTETKKPFILPEDIADATVYLLSTPPRVQVTELTIQPLGETL